MTIPMQEAGMAYSRRGVILGAACVVATPDVSWAAKALAVASDWSLATADRLNSGGRAGRLATGSTATA
jgi:hypothetical protein